MPFRFDKLLDRRGGDSVKWSRYGADVLPMWVADMDFASPPPILQALQERIAHGVFGYGEAPPELAELICDRLQRLYRWRVNPSEIWYLPGLVCGLNMVCKAIGEPADGVLTQTPVYPPFLAAPVQQQRRLQAVELACRPGTRLYYEPDFDALENAIDARTRLFLLCHPHNPVGRIFNGQELTRLAELGIRHDLIICSDEIHCDLLLDDNRHRPLATLAPEVADRCITLLAPSKTFNIAGLDVSFVVIQNPDLRRRCKAAAAGIVPHVNLLGFTAALAAYRDCDDWLTELRAYLTANRDFLLDYSAVHLPRVPMTCPEATYLAWLDCRQAGIPGNPQQFFLDKANVALNDGATFGPGGAGFVRLNFGCPRVLLEEGLQRMAGALNSVAPGA